MAWQRYENTDDFYLSESYYDTNIAKNIDKLTIMKNKLQEKFPKFIFYLQK
jgi:hypothetical protein